MKRMYVWVVGAAGGLILVFLVYRGPGKSAAESPVESGKPGQAPRSHGAAAKPQAPLPPTGSALWANNLSAGIAPSIHPARLPEVRQALVDEGDVKGLAALFYLSNDAETREKLLLHPEEPAACRALAMRGKTGQERQEWAEKLVALEPGDPSAKVLLASSLQEMGRPEDAMRELGAVDWNAANGLGINQETERQGELWKRCGADEAAAQTLAMESGYPQLMTGMITQMAATLDEGDAASGGIGTQMLAAVRASGLSEKSLKVEMGLLGAEIAIRKSSPAASSDEILKEESKRQRALRILDSRINDMLAVGDQNTSQDYYRQIQKGNVEQGMKWLLGETPEIQEAFPKTAP